MVHTEKMKGKYILPIYDNRISRPNETSKHVSANFFLRRTTIVYLVLLSVTVVNSGKNIIVYKLIFTGILL